VAVLVVGVVIVAEYLSVNDEGKDTVAADVVIVLVLGSTWERDREAVSVAKCVLERVVVPTVIVEESPELLCVPSSVCVPLLETVEALVVETESVDVCSVFESDAVGGGMGVSDGN
jgi:hypothetical protein